jgi:hypothetical protein
MEIGLEVNAEKTKHILISRHQHADQIHDLKIGKVHAFGNDSNKLMFRSRGNYEQIKFEKRLLPFSSESSSLIPSLKTFTCFCMAAKLDSIHLSEECNRVLRKTLNSLKSATMERLVGKVKSWYHWMREYRGFYSRVKSSHPVRWRTAWKSMCLSSKHFTEPVGFYRANTVSEENLQATSTSICSQTSGTEVRTNF